MKAHRKYCWMRVRLDLGYPRLEGPLFCKNMVFACILRVNLQQKMNDNANVNWLSGKQVWDPHNALGGHHDKPPPDISHIKQSGKNMRISDNVHTNAFPSAGFPHPITHSAHKIQPLRWYPKLQISRVISAICTTTKAQNLQITCEISGFHIILHNFDSCSLVTRLYIKSITVCALYIRRHLVYETALDDPARRAETIRKVL